jgi:hypothetical protein
MFTHNLLNVLVQTENKMGLQKKYSNFLTSDNIKNDPKGILSDGLDFSWLSKDWFQWRNSVNMLKTLRVS